MSDPELLQRYLQEGAADAFKALVEKHLNLVYSVARRHARSSALAEDVAQSVFIELAQNAANHKPGTPLVAWLHLVSRRRAINAARDEARRHAREQAAALLDVKPSSSSPDWSRVEPLLDEAVESLPERDRTAILLRYFENKSLRDVGAALGISDDTAQKRLSRALEQLRTYFFRRGIVVSAASLAHDLPAHALHGVPVGLGGAIAANIAVGSSAPASIGATKMVETLTMTTAQKSILFTALAVVVGTGLYEGRVLRAQADALRATHERLEGHAVRDSHSAQRACDRRRPARRRRKSNRCTARRTGVDYGGRRARRPGSRLAGASRAVEVRARATAASPHPRAATTPGARVADRRRRRQSGLRGGCSPGVVEIAGRAESISAQQISRALHAYVTAHQGQFPAIPRELTPYFDPPIDPAILGRYEMIELRGGPKVAVKQPADPELDAHYYIGTSGWGGQNAMSYNIGEAQKRFAAANHGQRATQAEQLAPYLKWAVSVEAVRKHLTSGQTGH